MSFPSNWKTSSSKTKSDGSAATKSTADDSADMSDFASCEDWFRLVQGAMKMRMHVAVLNGMKINDTDLRASEEDLTLTKSSTVDIYWILDSGGITLLIPYLMRKSLFWKMRTRKVRLIGLTARITELGSKLQELKDLLLKYRFTNWEPVVEVIEDMDTGSSDPTKETIATYESLPGVQPIASQKQPFWAKRWARAVAFSWDQMQHCAL